MVHLREVEAWHLLHAPQVRCRGCPGVRPAVRLRPRPAEHTRGRRGRRRPPRRRGLRPGAGVVGGGLRRRGRLPEGAAAVRLGQRGRRRAAPQACARQLGKVQFPGDVALAQLLAALLSVCSPAGLACRLARQPLQHLFGPEVVHSVADLGHLAEARLRGVPALLRRVPVGAAAAAPRRAPIAEGEGEGVGPERHDGDVGDGANDRRCAAIDVPVDVQRIQQVHIGRQPGLHQRLPRDLRLLTREARRERTQRGLERCLPSDFAGRPVDEKRSALLVSAQVPLRGQESRARDGILEKPRHNLLPCPSIGQARHRAAVHG
mmetsp:Transcript_171175/g.548701  ORF Transcript_171175/g.548701 Transcript_171175/m.548701 type:complete len:319 (+) Transcript_171175:1169-2125(+)